VEAHPSSPLLCLTTCHVFFFTRSLKEAIYKAVHPIICQYVSFREAEVTPQADGTATCNWLLKNGAQDQIDVLTAHWRKVADDKFFLTSASATKKMGRGDEEKV
jgi:4'-phosphopantetheinyl transferase EntD